MTMFYLIRGWLSRINSALAYLGAALLLLMCLAVVSEIISRTVFSVSGLWVIETSEYALLYITFLACPYLLEHKRHVMIDVLVNGLPPLASRWVALIVAIGAGALCVLVAYAGALTSIDQYQMGFRESTTLAPLSFWLTAIMPISLGLMALQFGLQVVHNLQEMVD